MADKIDGFNLRGGAGSRVFFHSSVDCANGVAVSLFCSQPLASSLSYRPGERLALSCLAVDLYSSVQLYDVVSMNVLAVKLDFRYATGLLDNNERLMTLLVYC